MNFQQLEYIIALDQFKNFSKAADACFVTQATLSTMVKKLEKELDITIFDRESKPIITTDCGQEIVEQAKVILKHADNLKLIANQVKGKIEGKLRIGVIPTIAGILLPHIIPKLLESYPSLQLDVKELTTEIIIEKIKSGKLDGGILSTPLSNSDLEEEILYYEKLMVYGKPQTKNAHFINPSDLSKENIWLLEEGNCLTDQIINICALQEKKINLNFNFRPNSFGSLMNLVDEMGGLTLIPELLYKRMSKNKKNKVQDFSAPYPVREISLVYHRPFAKLRLIEALTHSIKEIVHPLLDTTHLKNYEMVIAKM